MDHSSGLVFRRPQAASHRRAVVYFCSAVLKQFLETPFYGSRQMTRWLRRQETWVSRKRVRRLMRRLGLQAIFQRPLTSQPHPEHRIYPYLLRDLAITRPNQVWCSDVTYIPLARGFLYLVAVMD